MKDLKNASDDLSPEAMLTKEGLSPTILAISCETLRTLAAMKIRVWFREGDDHVQYCKHCEDTFPWTLGVPRPLDGMLYHISRHEREGFTIPKQLN